MLKIIIILLALVPFISLANSNEFNSKINQFVIFSKSEIPLEIEPKITITNITYTQNNVITYYYQMNITKDEFNEVKESIVNIVAEEKLKNYCKIPKSHIIKKADSKIVYVYYYTNSPSKDYLNIEISSSKCLEI